MRTFLAVSSMFLLMMVLSSCNDTAKEAQKPEESVVTKAASKTSTASKANVIDEVVYGEYLILTVTKPDMEKLRTVFKPLVFSEFKAISHNVIKIKLDKDPGLKALKDKAKDCKDIKEIEPNRIVRIPTPVK